MSQTKPSVPLNLLGVKNIIAVASAKGGVGKSTVAATLACELQKQGYKTGLLDTDLFGPSMGTLFNISQPDLYQDKSKLILPLHTENGLKLMSFGFLLGENPAIMRGPMVSGYMQQLLTGVKWGELDYLIIDMPPGTGDIQLTLSQTIQVDGAVIVTTRAALALVDVAKGILMFEKVGVPMLGIVENMSWFVCDNCDKQHPIFGEAKAPGEKFGLKTLAQIPLEPHRGKSFEKYTSNELNKQLVSTMISELDSVRSSKIVPPSVEQKDKTVVIKWEDGREWNIDAFKLRCDCHCANCVDEYTGAKLINEAEIPKDIAITSSTPLGNYAISLVWSDGHSSGIYPYSQLEKLI